MTLPMWNVFLTDKRGRSLGVHKIAGYNIRQVILVLEGVTIPENAHEMIIRRADEDGSDE